MPVTRGGNSQAIRWMFSAITTWTTAVTSTAPHTAASPRSAASGTATEMNTKPEPIMIGSRPPTIENPMVCSSVARPAHSSAPG